MGIIIIINLKYNEDRYCSPHCLNIRIKLVQKDAPPPLNADVAFAGSFSDSPVSAGFVQLADDAKKEAVKEEKKEEAKEEKKEAVKEEKKEEAKEEKKEEAKEEKKSEKKEGDAKKEAAPKAEKKEAATEKAA